MVEECRDARKQLVGNVTIPWNRALPSKERGRGPVFYGVLRKYRGPNQLEV